MLLNISVNLLKPVLVIEDDPLYQQKILKILALLGYANTEIHCVQSLNASKKIIEEINFELFLVDLNLPDGNGLDFIKLISQNTSNQRPIMVLSAWNTVDVVYEALNEGASGYVFKENDDFEIIYAIRTILQGGGVIDSKIALKVIQSFNAVPCSQTPNKPASMTSLSEREQQILECVAQGYSSKEIGEKLNISKYTVDVHIKHIYKKLEVNSRTKAIYAGKEQGLLS